MSRYIKEEKLHTARVITLSFSCVSALCLKDLRMLRNFLEPRGYFKTLLNEGNFLQHRGHLKTLLNKGNFLQPRGHLKTLLPVSLLNEKSSF